MTDDIMCYAARFPGHAGYGAIVVDRPEFSKDSAKDISKWIRKGAVVERVTIEQARAGMKEYLDERTRKPRLA